MGFMVTKHRRDLRAELVLRGMNASDAARRMGVNPSTVSRLLSGETPWSERNARAFSFATGIPLATILPNGQEAS
jgi:transcriptional regulator with XRE-family HTH domain